jgi:hypothetical protein
LTDWPASSSPASLDAFYNSIFFHNSSSLSIQHAQHHHVGSSAIRRQQFGAIPNSYPELSHFISSALTTQPSSTHPSSAFFSGSSQLGHQRFIGLDRVLLLD